MAEHNESRRRFLKKTSYVAPVILTLSVAPSFARTGSSYEREDDGHDCPRDRDERDIESKLRRPL